MRWPWQCPTAIDVRCPDRRIEVVGRVEFRTYLFVSDMHDPNKGALQLWRLGRCRRCGREHHKAWDMYWTPNEAATVPPPDSAKTYMTSYAAEVDALEASNSPTTIRARIRNRFRPPAAA